MKKGGGLRRKEFPKLSEAAWARKAHLAQHPPNHQRPLPLASGDNFCRRRQKDFTLPLWLPHCPHTPQDSAASSNSPWMTHQGPQSPQHSQNSVRNQARFQSRTVCLQSFCSSGVVHCPPCILTHQQRNRSVSSVPRGLSNCRAKLL